MNDKPLDAPTLVLLGEIKGLVQGLKDSQDALHDRLSETNGRIDRMGMEVNSRIERLGSDLNQRIDGVDARLRLVEQKAAVIGAASGGAMALGTALIVEGIKHYLGRGGN